MPLWTLRRRWAGCGLGHGYGYGQVSGGLLCEQSLRRRPAARCARAEALEAEALEAAAGHTTGGQQLPALHNVGRSWVPVATVRQHVLFFFEVQFMLTCT